MRRRKSTREVIGTSFLDLVSCGLGGAMLLLFVMAAILGNAGSTLLVEREEKVDVRGARITVVLDLERSDLTDCDGYKSRYAGLVPREQYRDCFEGVNPLTGESTLVVRYHTVDRLTPGQLEQLAQGKVHVVTTRVVLEF